MLCLIVMLLSVWVLLLLLLMLLLLLLVLTWKKRMVKNWFSASQYSWYPSIWVSQEKRSIYNLSTPFSHQYMINRWHIHHLHCFWSNYEADIRVLSHQILVEDSNRPGFDKKGYDDSDMHVLFFSRIWFSSLSINQSINMYFRLLQGYCWQVMWLITS